MKQTFHSEVKQTEDGELFVELPDELLEDLGWNERTFLTTTLENKAVVIREKTEFTVEEAQIAFEDMLEACQKDRKSFKIIDPETDKAVVMVPYSREMMTYLSSDSIESDG